MNQSVFNQSNLKQVILILPPPCMRVMETCSPSTDYSIQQFNTGKWTEYECLQFQKLYNKYGRNWQKIASQLGTRKKSQVVSHAQKYFNKKEKLEQMERDLREANNISAAPRKRCILKEVETNCGSPALELRQNYNGSKLQNKSNQWNILEQNPSYFFLSFLQPIIGVTQPMFNFFDYSLIHEENKQMIQPVISNSLQINKQKIGFQKYQNQIGEQPINY